MMEKEPVELIKFKDTERTSDGAAEKGTKFYRSRRKSHRSHGVVSAPLVIVLVDLVYPMGKATNLTTRVKGA